jgi:hypothetical protein
MGFDLMGCKSAKMVLGFFLVVRERGEVASKADKSDSK